MRHSKLLRHLREFWRSIEYRAYDTFLGNENDSVVRLHALAPTVPQKAVDDLEKKRQAWFNDHPNYPIG